LKIVHFSFSKSGGAGAVARILSDSQKELGHESLFEYLTEGNLRQQPVKNPSITIAAGIDEYLIKNQKFENQISVMRSQLGRTSLEPVRAADIVHLHWVPGQISLRHLMRVMDEAKSVVWTLHDMWPITGGCHFSSSCAGFQSNCSSCPAVKTIFQKSVEAQLSMKAELFRLYSSKLKIVAPSTWLANQAQSSTALTGKNVSVIPNPVSRLPNPGSGSKRNSRVLLGISESAFVVAFSAANLDDKRKGLEELLSQLEVFAQDNPQISIQLLLLGASRRKVSCPGLTVIQRGFVSAYQAKTDLQAADVLVNFSQEENLSMSLIEALSASVPILALDSGGNSDIVQEGKTGFLIESPQILPIRLKQFADSPDLVSKFAREARKDFEERFAADKVAKSYIELYNL